MKDFSDERYKFLFWLSRKINRPLVPPDVIQISLTYRCNLKCKMCRIVNLLPQDQELSTEQVFRVIDKAADYGIREVLLTGGEPFLREDIFRICEYSNSKGLKSIITTNGVLIDDNSAEAIADSGVSHIHFSLDGLEHANDFLRGRGVFSKVIEVINILNKKRNNGRFFSLGIACTVMNVCVGELYDLVRLADDLKVDVINFQPLANDNTNFLDRSSSPFWLREEDITVLQREMKRIRKYKPKYTTINEEPRLELLIKYYQAALTRKDWVCFGGFKTVFICFSKNQPLVYSCHGICGNLNGYSLKKVWQSKEARKLRIHSKKCRNLCMQSCYSQESAQSLGSLVKATLKR